MSHSILPLRFTLLDIRQMFAIKADFTIARGLW